MPLQWSLLILLYVMGESFTSQSGLLISCAARLLIAVLRSSIFLALLFTRRCLLHKRSRVEILLKEKSFNRIVLSFQFHLKQPPLTSANLCLTTFWLLITVPVNWVKCALTDAFSFHRDWKMNCGIIFTIQQDFLISKSHVDQANINFHGGNRWSS